MDRKEIRLFEFGTALTNEQLSYFRQHGIIQFRQFIDRPTVAALLKEVSRAERYLLDKGITKENGIQLKFGQDVDGSTLIQRIAFASHYSPVLKKFLKDPRLAALSGLLGDYEGRTGENEKDGLVVNHYINTAVSAFRRL